MRLAVAARMITLQNKIIMLAQPRVMVVQGLAAMALLVQELLPVLVQLMALAEVQD
jgi:hypothetical protein